MGKLLSETLKLSPREVKDWLEKETESIFLPVHARAQKLLEEMEKALKDVEGACKVLLEASRREIERRNMKVYKRARGLNKLARLFLERIQQINIPENVTYDSLHNFLQETQKAFTVTDIDIKNWFPRISPFFILDRRKFSTSFEKAKEKLRVLQDFLTKKYIKIKTLEETFHLIDNLLTLERKQIALEAKKRKIDAEKTSIENQIAEKQQNITSLKNKKIFTRLNQIDLEIEKLRFEVKHTLRHLQKPFIKFRSLTFREGGLTPKELQKLDQYIQSPFEALVTEENEYPILRQILQKLNVSMTQNKLKLKNDKKRKAERAINNIINNNSLSLLYQKSKNTLTLKQQLLKSPEIVKIQETITRLQEELKELERKRNQIKSEETTTKQILNETLKTIYNYKNKISKNVSELLGIKKSISNNSKQLRT